MIIFELDLRRLKPQILVKNLSGAILCRLSKRGLDNPQTLQKRIRKKLDNDICIHVIKQPDNTIMSNENVDIYIIRNMELDKLVNKIKNRFSCCIYDHDHEIYTIYDEYNQDVDRELRRYDFIEFKDNLDLFSYLLGYNGTWLIFASSELQLNRKLILKATKRTPSAVCNIPTSIPHDGLRDQFNKIWDDTKIINRCLKHDKYCDFCHISLRIRSIPKYAKKFVERSLYNFTHIPHKISNYRELCIIAAKQGEYKYMSENMRDDLEIVKTVIMHSHIYAILMIKTHLFNKIDYDIVKQCIIKFIKYSSVETLYDHLPYQLREDITLAQIGAKTCQFKSIPVKLRRNPEIIQIYLSRHHSRY